MGPLYTAPSQVRIFLPLDLPSSLTDDTLNAAIERWSRYVDDYVAGVYKVPFAAYPDTPGAISAATEMLTVYWLYVMMGMASDKEDPRQSLWRRAHEILERIRNLEIVLDIASDATDGVLRSTGPLATGPGQNPMSLSRQGAELGPPHRRTLGGTPLGWLPPDEEA